MPHIEQVNSQEEQNRLVDQQSGSEWMITGCIFFIVGATLSIFNFSDLRQGTFVMIAYTSALIVIGLVLIAIGEYKRSNNI